MINGDSRYRVWNNAKFDIGIHLMNNVEMNIIPGSFVMLTVNDILFLESRYPNAGLFRKKLLVAMDDNGEELDLLNIGLPAADENAHHSDEEIIAVLKGGAKKLETWLEEIDDPAELHAIYEVAKTLDLPVTKVKILKKFMPNKDWLDDLG